MARAASCRRRRCGPFEPEPTGELATIETAISSHRALYLRAVWAGHTGEADYHESEVDRLIGRWADVQRATEV